VNKKNSRILQKGKRNIEKRLRRKGWKAQAKPMFSAKNIHYEVSDKSGGIGVGGDWSLPSVGDANGIAEMCG